MIDTGIHAHPRSARYLSEQERVVIADQRRARHTMRAIARELGRDVSSISREPARNKEAGRAYRPLTAQRMATARLACPRARKVAKDPVLAAAKRSHQLAEGFFDPW
jgi:IS30 family transposase